MAGFSALQRAEIAEMIFAASTKEMRRSFSALQRAEIAEIAATFQRARRLLCNVSVLFNEPKLLKSRPSLPALPVSQILIPARRRS